jgi:hypothetical protein
MKKQLLILVSVLSLLLATGSAFAQSRSIKANVPFNFVINRTTMPAGAYTITSVGTGETLRVQGVDNKAIMLVNANYAQAGHASAKTKLVFRCYGDRYILSQIWTEGSDRGRQLPKAAAESELARDFTAHDVILVASLR